MLLKIEVFWNVLYVVSTDKATDVSKDRNTFIFRIQVSESFDCLTLKMKSGIFRSVMSVILTSRQGVTSQNT